MSECVVRMEMPRRCAECPIQGYALNCRIPLPHYKSALRSPSERPSWCPIICQLPEGHGRLIDADDCIKHLFTEWVKGEISNSEWCNIRQCMNEETTIVPAEAERSGE